MGKDQVIDTGIQTLTSAESLDSLGPEPSVALNRLTFQWEALPC